MSGLVGPLALGGVVWAAGIDNRPGDDLPGLLAFGVVALLVVCCVVLFRSMRTRLQNIRFDEGAPGSSATPSGSTSQAMTRADEHGADDGTSAGSRTD